MKSCHSNHTKNVPHSEESHSGKEASSSKGALKNIMHNPWLMVAMCIVPILALWGGSTLFGWKIQGGLFFVMMAACMLGHLLMMHNHGNEGHKGH